MACDNGEIVELWYFVGHGLEPLSNLLGSLGEILQVGLCSHIRSFNFKVFE